MKHTRYRRRDILRLFAAGCVITLCVVVVHVMRPELLIHFEHKVYDVMLSQTGERPSSNVPVLIAIDDRSLTRLGQWPWPRDILGRLITRLREAGADTVTLDLILSTRDRTSPALLLEELRRDSGLSLNLKEIPRGRLDHDLVLADALRQIPSVLGYKLLFAPMQGDASACRIHPIMTDQNLPPYFRCMRPGTPSVPCRAWARRGRVRDSSMPCRTPTASSGGFRSSPRTRIP